MSDDQLSAGVHSESSLEQNISNEKDEIVESLLKTNPDALQLHKKQPIVWRCLNPHCRPDKFRPTIMFDFESDEAKCPKCSLGPPMVVKRALIHMLVMIENGPIVGDMGMRYRVACDAKRDYVTNGRDGEAGTGDIRQVNCPACLKELADRMVRFGYSLRMGDS